MPLFDGFPFLVNQSIHRQSLASFASAATAKSMIDSNAHVNKLPQYGIGDDITFSLFFDRRETFPW